MLPRDVSSATMTWPGGALCFIATVATRTDEPCFVHPLHKECRSFQSQLSCPLTISADLANSFPPNNSVLAYPASANPFPPLTTPATIRGTPTRQPRQRLPPRKLSSHPSAIIPLLEEAGSRKKECPARTGDPAHGCGLSWRMLALRHGYHSLQICCRVSSLVWLSFILTPVETVPDPT